MQRTEEINLSNDHYLFHKDVFKLWTEKYISKLPLQDQAAFVRTCRQFWKAGQPNLAKEKIIRLSKRRCYFLLRNEMSRLSSHYEGMTLTQRYWIGASNRLSRAGRFYKNLTEKIQIAYTFKDYYELIYETHSHIHDLSMGSIFRFNNVEKLGYALICILREAMKIIFREDYLDQCQRLRYKMKYNFLSNERVVEALLLGDFRVISKYPQLIRIIFPYFYHSDNQSCISSWDLTEVNELLKTQLNAKNESVEIVNTSIPIEYQSCFLMLYLHQTLQWSLSDFDKNVARDVPELGVRQDVELNNSSRKFL